MYYDDMAKAVVFCRPQKGNRLNIDKGTFDDNKSPLKKEDFFIVAVIISAMTGLSFKKTEMTNGYIAFKSFRDRSHQRKGGKKR